MVILVDDAARKTLLRPGFALEFMTLGWNVIGVVILTVAAIAARSVALAGFGLDSLIEIGASTVVIWELSGTGQARQRRALRLIGYAFAALAVYLLVQSTVVLAAGYHPRHSTVGIGWTAVTAAVMFALAFRQGPHRRRPRQSRPPDRRPGHPDRRHPGHRRPDRPGAERRPRLVVGRPRGRVCARLLRRP
jgi:hypothetical protein